MDPMGLWVTNLTTICLMGLLGKPSCLMGKSTINGDLMGCNGIYHLVVIDSSPWKDPSFLIGKPSISMGHGFHGELLNNQRVYPSVNYQFAIEHGPFIDDVPLNDFIMV